MKRNSLFKGIVLSTAVSAVLTGCGSVDSLVEDIKAEIAQSSIRGKAIDGYLKDAVVCLDLNKDGYCQASSEPLTTTLDDGSFTLAVSEAHRAHENFDEALLLVFGGVDVDTGKDFRGKLYAPNDGGELLNVSPITTLVAKNLEKELRAERKLTREQIKERIKAARKKVADALEIDEDQIGLDPVAFQKTNKDDKLIRKALQIQKSIEALMFAAGVEDSERKDKIEEIYEALAEGLDDLGGEKGLKKLFEKAAEKDKFKNMFQEQDRDSMLALTEAITQNIDTAFDGFDQDEDQLEKIGALTEDVFAEIEKDVKNPQDGFITGIVFLENDDRFQDNFDWNRKHILGDLTYLGMDNPSSELVESIIALFHGHEKIRPGILFIKKERLRDAEDENLKRLYVKIKNFEAELKEKKEKEEAQKDSQIVKIQAPMSIYTPEHDGYGKVTFNTDNTLTFQKYEVQEDGTFALENDEDEEEYRDFVYSNGAWKQNQESAENYTIDASGAIMLPDMHEKAYLVNEKDISGLTREVPNFGIDVQMPNGSKISFVKIEKMDDTYSLHEQVRDYSTQDQMPYGSISDFIQGQCQNRWFMGDERGGLAFKGTLTDDGYVCDGSAKSGELVVASSNSFGSDFAPSAGKWEIKTLDGNVDVLIVKPYDIRRFEDHDDEVRYPIFAMNGSTLYRGDFEQKGTKHAFPAFNEVAINAIAKSVTENWSDIKNVFDAEFNFGRDQPIQK